MSLKTELIRWQEALDAFDNKDYATAIKTYLEITDIGAKIFYNMGMIYTVLDRHEDAVISYTNAIFQDKYLAVAYFQRGVSQYLLKDYNAALESFTDTIEFLRDNVSIDYNQLGLSYKLFSFEVFFNRALCFFALDHEHDAMLDLEEAQKDVVLPVHQRQTYKADNVLHAYRDGKMSKYRPFVVPPGLMYRPPAIKMENIKNIDYLGSSKVIATSNEHDQYSGFTGAKVAEAFEHLEDDQESMPIRRKSDETVELSSRARRGQPVKRRASTETTGADSVASAASSDRLRVKCYYNSDKRLMMVPKAVEFVSLKSKLLQKYGISDAKIKYWDEDGEKVLMTDQEDLEMAMQALEFTDSNKLDLFLE